MSYEFTLGDWMLSIITNKLRVAGTEKGLKLWWPPTILNTVQRNLGLI